MTEESNDTGLTANKVKASVNDNVKKDGNDETDRRKSSRKNIPHGKKIALVLIIVVMVVISLAYWWHSSFWESTDDAQIDGHINPISARVGGHVIRLHFRDYQYVQAGDLLVEIDPTDYRVALERAKADYSESLAGVLSARTDVPIAFVVSSSGIAAARAELADTRAGVAGAEKELEAARARLREADARNIKAQSDLGRYRPLVERDVISRQQFDQVVAAASIAAASVDAARSLSISSREKVTQARSREQQSLAALEAARTGPRRVSITRSKAESARAISMRYKAALEQAELNLRYTRIVAPVAGIIGKRTVEIGQNVEPGQVLLSIVPLDNIWVTANFKETQLSEMRAGQSVKIRVDAYGRTYDGHVDSIGGASGARFSLFPPENATGNYVKVVQRVPVKIVFEKGQDREHLLRPGMSVVPDVRVK